MQKLGLQFLRTQDSCGGYLMSRSYPPCIRIRKAISAIVVLRRALYPRTPTPVTLTKHTLRIELQCLCFQPKRRRRKDYRAPTRREHGADGRRRGRRG